MHFISIGQDLLDGIRYVAYEMVHGIFSFAAAVYTFMLEIAYKTLVDADTLNSILDSFYTLIGVFMLFRIAISLLNYLVNPEAISDKSSGGGKLLSRVVIAILLVVAGPFIFKEAGELQTAIVGDGDSDPGIIFRLINFGDPVTVSVSSSGCTIDSGTEYAFNGFIPFLNTTETFNDADVDYTFDDIKSDVKATFAQGTGCDASTSAKNRAKANIKGYFDSSYLNYDFFIGLLVGIAFIIFAIIMCIDITVRNLKLLVLQIISPVAFMCYINPKDKIFNQWLKTYGSVYADLFIKLISVSFMAQLIKVIYDMGDLSALQKIFYLLGLFVFVKALPDFISKVFGIQGMGSFKESAGMLKKGLGLAAGATAGLVAGGIGAHKIAQAARARRAEKTGKTFKDLAKDAKDKGGIKTKEGRKAQRAAARRALTNVGGSLTSSFLSTGKAMTKGAGAGFKGKGVDSSISSVISDSDKKAEMVQSSDLSDRGKAFINNKLGTRFGGSDLEGKRKSMMAVADEHSKSKSVFTDRMKASNYNGYAEKVAKHEAFNDAIGKGDYTKALLSDDGNGGRFEIKKDKTGFEYLQSTSDPENRILLSDTGEIQNAAIKASVSENQKFKTDEKKLLTQYVKGEKDEAGNIINNDAEAMRALQNFHDTYDKAKKNGVLESTTITFEENGTVKSIDAAGKDQFKEIADAINAESVKFDKENQGLSAAQAYYNSKK